MTRNLFIGLCALAVFCALIFIKREPVIMSYLAATIEKTGLEAHRAFLKPHIEYRPPASGSAPYPTVFLFHGCSGKRQAFMDQWAAVANEAGYMAVIVDSNGARGIDYETSLKTVCAGTELIGQERTGDILAALNLGLTHSEIDPDRIILAGWSHGAWTVMDYLTMDLDHKRPPQFTPSEPLDAPSPIGAILFYPYCGQGALSRFAPPANQTPTLAFVAGQDTIVNAEECLKVFDKLKATGEPIDLVYYPDAEHIFDGATLTGELRERYYDEASAKDATAKVRAFLAGKLNGEDIAATPDAAR